KGNCSPRIERTCISQQQGVKNMAKGSAKETSLREGFEMALKFNGAIIVVRVHPAAIANEKAPTSTPAELKPGDRIPDGTIYAGISPGSSGKAMYTTSTDAPLPYTFDEAATYAKQLNKQRFLGHDDWRVPTKHELNE